MAVLLIRCSRNRLRGLGRVRVALKYSTAAQQRSAGDDCHADDSDVTPVQTHAVTNVQMLEMRATKLGQEVQSLTEKHRKAVADSEAVRRRTQKFVEDAKIFGIQNFCRDLVEVADLLELVLRELLEGEEEGGAGVGGEGAQRTRQSLQRVQRRLEAVFVKHGLEKMAPVGGAYDPYQHQVVCHVAAEGVEPGAVALVEQEGYKLHGRTIRHARVGLAMTMQEPPS